VDQFLRDVDSVGDTDRSGIAEEMGSYRLSILATQIMAFKKSVKR
jgi:hypothetical protein